MPETPLSYEEDTRQAEMGKKSWIETNGAKVGWDTPINDLDVQDLKKTDKKEKPIPSIAEMQENKDKWNANLVTLAQTNPDVLATKDRWPEAVKQAGLEVGEKWPL